MFTGLIEAVGSVQQCALLGGDYQLTVATPAGFTADLKPGDSIAVNGICLTVIRYSEESFSADMSVTTVRDTTVKSWRNGTLVNLEKALTLATRLGGHIVTGHIDGVAKVVSKTKEGRSWRLAMATPAGLHSYLAPKGSLAVDGVSLTINAFQQGLVSLNIVPHTLQATILHSLAAGNEVNIEADILARYAEQLLRYGSAESGEPLVRVGLSKQVLAEHGFIK